MNIKIEYNLFCHVMNAEEMNKVSPQEEGPVKSTEEDMVEDPENVVGLNKDEQKMIKPEV